MFIQNDLKYKNLSMDELTEGDVIYLSLFDMSKGNLYVYLGRYLNVEGVLYHRIVDCELKGFSYYYDGYVYKLEI